MVPPAMISGWAIFKLYFPQEIPDLANISLPDGWTYLAGSWRVDGRASSMLEVSASNGPGVLIGQVLHLSFTTLPRQTVNLNACERSEGSWPDAPCGQAQGSRIRAPRLLMDR